MVGAVRGLETSIVLGSITGIPGNSLKPPVPLVDAATAAGVDTNFVMFEVGKAPEMATGVEEERASRWGESKANLLAYVDPGCERISDKVGTLLLTLLMREANDKPELAVTALAAIEVPDEIGTKCDENGRRPMIRTNQPHRINRDSKTPRPFQACAPTQHQTFFKFARTGQWQQ